MGQLEPQYAADGTVKWCICFGNSRAVPPKVKYRITIEPSNSASKYRPQRSGTKRSHNVHECSQQRDDGLKVETTQLPIGS